MPDTDHTTPDPTHGRIDRDIQAAVDDWGPKSLGQRVAVENTLQAQRDAGRKPLAQPARERPADADAHPETGGGSSAVLGRAMLDDEGTLWWWSDEDDCYRSGDLYLNDPANIGLVREVLLVSPEAGRVLDAARRWNAARDAWTNDPSAAYEYLNAEFDLAAAVDTLGDPQQPLQVAAAPPTDGAGSLGVEPAPEPDSGPGWDQVPGAARAAWLAELETERARWGHYKRLYLGGLEIAEQLRAELAEVTADRDRAVAASVANGKTAAEWHRHALDARKEAEQAWSAAGDMAAIKEGAARDRAEVERLRGQQNAHEGELGDMRAQLSATEADLDGVVLQRDRLLVERATARRDAAADALVSAAQRYREMEDLEATSHPAYPSDIADTLETMAAEIRSGARPVPGSPEPAADSPTTTDTEE